MKKLDQLLVRACKSNDPDTRLRSVYRRFYLMQDDPEVTTVALVNILSRIVDEYVPFTSCLTVLQEMAPSRLYNATYNERALSLLMNRIRLSAKDRFPGMTTPARFRNKGQS